MNYRSLLKILPFILICASLSMSAGCNNSEVSQNSSHQEIVVFAGSASKPPLDEAADTFMKETGTKVTINYGGSGTMLSQMKITKTGDLYIPGSPDYMIKAAREGVVDLGSERVIAYLIPAISVQKGNPLNITKLSDLTRPGIKIGIGNPEAVCVGLYAIEIMDKNSLLKDIFPNIVVQAESCEKTAALLSLKSVDAVMGWDVFSHWDPDNIQTVYLEPAQTSRIAYIPAATSSFCADRALAEKFLAFLQSETGQAIFRKWGYVTSENEARQFAPNAEIGGEYELPELYRALIEKGS